MPTSPISNSETKAPLPPNHLQQKYLPLIRPQQGQATSKTLTILAVLVFLVLGYANLAPASAYWPLPGEKTKDTGIASSYNPDELSPLADRLYPIHDVTPTVVKSFAKKTVSSPSPTPSPTKITLPTASPTPTATVASEIEYVVIITIDGLRPDALDLANTPTLDNLRAKGAYSPNAQTIIPSFTLPAHVSMLNGVRPKKHGIVEALPCIGCRLTIGPTLFSVAHDAGLRTGLAVGKEKLSYLVLPNSVDDIYCNDAHDPEVQRQAIEFIEAGLPNILFIHLPDTDRVGHVWGWMSENQLYAITFADGLIGGIITALKKGGYLNRTLLIITSDHGGHGFKHGDDSPVDRTVPWLAVGPGVPSDVIINCKIDTIDTAATALYALDLPIPERWEGQPVLEIFQ